MIKTFRTKPVEIQAVQFNGNFDEIEHFVGGDSEYRDRQLVVATFEGPLRASAGDWIIRGVNGEFYPCKPDIFEATYEPVQAITVEVKRRAEDVIHAANRGALIALGWTPPAEPIVTDDEPMRA